MSFVDGWGSQAGGGVIESCQMIRHLKLRRFDRHAVTSSRRTFLATRAIRDGLVHIWALSVATVLWMACTSCPWRNRLDEFGNWNTIFKRFCRWMTADAFRTVCSERWPKMLTLLAR